MKKKKVIVLAIVAVIAVSMVAAVFVIPGMRNHKNREGQGKIAVIYVEGMIIGGRGQGGLLGETGGTDAIIRQLHEARDDDSIQAVVLRVNSPGGSASASQEVGEEIQKLRSTGKPIVTSMGDVAASGGYWIAALTDKIYANPATLTGSIGVYIPYTNWQELFKKIGVQQEKIKSGPHKDIMSPDRPMTPEERTIIQTMVDDMYNQFVEIVAQGRKLEPDKVRKLADGRIYTGKQAKELGLVDELGNMYDAIDAAAQLAGIQGKPEIKEFGGNPWTALLNSAGSKIDLEKLLVNPVNNELPLIAPIAMPEKW